MIEHIETLPEASNPLQVDAGMNERNQSSNAPAEFVSSDYELILRDYNKTLDLSPDFFFGYFNRAVIFLKMKKYDDAIRDLNKAIELESEFAEAFYNRGLVRIFQNDTKGGALDLSKAGELGLTEAYSIIKRYCN